METFKREHFQAEHPDQTFPAIEPIAERDAEFVRNEWSRKLDVEPEADPLTLLNAAEARSEAVNGAAGEEDFNLADILIRAGVRAAETVYINWDRFDAIDAIALRDLSAFFDFIWYPAVDDIEVFDRTCSWMLLIRHYGAVRLLRLPR